MEPVSGVKSWRHIDDFLRETAGAALLYVAFAMVAVIGFTGMAIDIGYWYSNQRQAQVAADAAAIAGGFEAMWGGDAAAISAAAAAQAELNGFDAATVTVNRPPTSGPNSGDPTAVEVIIQRTTPAIVTSILFDTRIDVAGRAVAGQVAGTPLCILALRSSGQGIDLNSDSHIEADGCLVHANSNSGSAIKTNSGSSVSAETISVVGGTSGSGFSPSPEMGADAISNPLLHLRPPPNAGAPCDHNSTDYKSDQTIYPGVYCGDHVVDDGATVTLSGGTYVFRGDKFEVNSGSTIRTNAGDGATLFLASDVEFTLNSESSAELEAPATGDLAGVVIYSVGTEDLEINSDSASFFEGTLYAPTARIKVNSDSTIGGDANFTAVVAKEIDLNSESTLVVNSDYAGSTVPSIPTLGASRIAIFE